MARLKQLTHITAIAFAGSLLASTANSESLFIDSFESGDMSATNEDGFKWLHNNRTSVVTSDAVVYSNGEKYIAMPSGRDWNPKHGEHSLRFRYPAGQPMAEQRYKLGEAYPDIWFQYWVRVPINYFHGQNSPNNHKFFALWMDGYSHQGIGPTVIWEFWGDNTGSSRLAYHYSEGGNTILGGHKSHQDFISVPDDRGRWMEITLHVKASSQGQSNDGVIELWRRWKDESPSERKLFHRQLDAVLPLPPGGPEGWANGYFMGWANGSYSNDTEWLIDHIVISENSLLEKGGPQDVSGLAPNPPVLTLKK